ncbi:MAG: hypothetical protein GEV03_27205 [Streptosporangiales bacterium]|nr:hypothetical protein [Streptosporangiales bacterium]
MRILMQPVASRSLPARKYIEAISSQGAQVRSAVDLPPTMLILDHQVALIVADQGQPTQRAVLLSEEVVVSFLLGLFEIFWHNASPCPSTSDFARGHPSPLEASLVRWLAEGHKDESIARHLGMSVRTCRRHVANVMKRLEAASRFEAGVKAARRGWL